jgi:hypothetical protein
MKESFNHILGVLLSTIGARTANFIIFYIITRNLEENDANRFFLFFTLLSLASVLSDFGMRNKLYTDIAKQTKRCDIEKLVYSAHKTKIALAAPTFLFSMILTTMYIKDISLLEMILFFLCAFLFPTSDIASQSLRGIRKSYYELQTIFIEKGMTITLFIIGHIYNQLSIKIILIIFLLSFLSKNLLSFYLLKKITNDATKKLSKTIKSITKSDLYKKDLSAGLTLFADALYLKLPILLLPYLKPGYTITEFTIALAIIHSSLIIPSLTSNSILPLFYKKNINIRESWITNYYIINIALSILALPVFYLFFEYFLSILSNKQTVDYKPMIYAIPFIVVSQSARFLMIAEGLSFIFNMALTFGICVYTLIFFLSEYLYLDIPIGELYLFSEIAIFTSIFSVVFLRKKPPKR